MQDYSTLFYFVNNFQNDLETTKLSLGESCYENEETTKMDMEPSERSIKNILDFARSYEVLETETTGHVEMILN